MKTKTVSQLDSAGYFVGLALADESPMEPGVFLLPGGTVDAPAPTVPQGQRAKWTGKAFALEDIPAPEPEPQPPEPTRADVIRMRLNAIDMESIRPARAVAAAMASGQPAPAFDAAKLASLEAEAQALRQELASL